MACSSTTDMKGKTVFRMAPSSCCSSAPQPPADAAEESKVNRVRYFGAGAAFAAAWLLLYVHIHALASWLTFDVLALGRDTPIGSAVDFFLYDTAKIILLLVIMVYAIAWLRAGMHTERIRSYLSGRGRGVGYVLAACFGAVTPFCSCSSIPLFIGFVTARIPIGITMAFLITSPMINEIAVVLLWGLLGWKFTLIYVSLGLGAGIVGGIIMDALKAERWLQPFLLEAMQRRDLPMGVSGAAATPGLLARHRFARQETATICRKVWLWVVVGVALGAALHGYVPRDWFAEHLGAGQWWSVPAAVALGIPLYTNVTGIVPVMESLLLKGLPLGTTLAFCMSTVTVSLPEMMMLKQVMRWQLLALFLGLLLCIFTLAGWLFNAVPL